MSVEAVIAGNPEARKIVDAIMMDKTLASEAIEAFLAEGLTGDALVDYFNMHYVSKNESVYESVHDMARAAVCSLHASEDI